MKHDPKNPVIMEEHLPIGLVTIQPDGIIIDANPAFLAMMGAADKKMMIGENITGFFYYPEDRDRWQGRIKQGHISRNFVVRLRRLDERVIWTSFNIQPVLDEQGHQVATECSIEDITTRKQYEEELQESQCFLKSVINSMPASITILDAAGRIIEINDGWRQFVKDYALDIPMFGLGSKYVELCRKYIHGDEEHVGRICNAVAKQLAGEPGAVEIEYSCAREENKRWFLMQAQPFHIKQQLRLVILHMEITRIKQAEEAFKRSEDRYRRFFDEDLTGDFIADAAGDILACNQSFAKIFGFSTTEQAIHGNFFHFFFNDQIRKDFLNLLERTSQLKYHEYEYRRLDGQSLHVIQNISCTKDDQGNLLEIKGYLFDNTERKILEEQLRHLQKMEAVSRLAGGIAHDFNNLLSVIMGYSDILKYRFPDNDPGKKYITEISKAAEWGGNLVRQLLTFSRRQIPQPTQLNLSELVSGMREMLEHIMGENNRVIVSLSPGLNVIKADRGQIEQIIVNLALNARDAMPAGGQLNISTENQMIDGGCSMRYAGSRPGAFVEISVKDIGSGMNADVLEHLFDPFYTTKEVGKGSWLGLSTVYGIVEQSGGFINVASEPGKGSEFRLFFPVAAAQPEASSSSLAPGPTQVMGKEVILLVEDQEMIRKMVLNILERYGYTVIDAASGEEALNICQNMGNEVDLVLTDVIMDGMNGCELAYRLMDLYPGIRVLYMSGYADNTIIEQGILRPGMPFIQKPFMPDILLTKIRQVLGISQAQEA